MASSFGVSDQFNLIFYCADGDKTGKIDMVPFDCVDYQCTFDLEKMKIVAEGTDEIIPTLISYAGVPCIMYQKDG